MGGKGIDGKNRWMFCQLLSSLAFALGWGVSQGSWRTTANSFWAHSGCSWGRAVGACAARQTRRFTIVDCWPRTLCNTWKACVRFTVWLVYAICEITALLSSIVAPVFNHSRWCSRMPSDKCPVMQSMYIVPQELSLSTIKAPRGGVWIGFEAWLLSETPPIPYQPTVPVLL